MAKRKTALFVPHEKQEKSVTFKVSEELKERLDSIDPALKALGISQKFDHAEHLRSHLDELVTEAEAQIQKLRKSHRNTGDRSEREPSEADTTQAEA